MSVRKFFKANQAEAEADVETIIDNDPKIETETVTTIENGEPTPSFFARIKALALTAIMAPVTIVKMVIDVGMRFWRKSTAEKRESFFGRLFLAGCNMACAAGLGLGLWFCRADLQAIAGFDPRPEANLATLLQEGAELRREADTMRNKAEGIRISVAIKAPTEARHLSTEQLADATLRIQAILNALADNDRSPVTVNVNSAPVAGTQTSAYAYLVVCSNGTTNVDIYDAKGLTEAFAIMGVTVSVPNLSGSGWLGTWAEGRFGIRWGGESLF